MKSLGVSSYSRSGILISAKLWYIFPTLTVNVWVDIGVLYKCRIDLETLYPLTSVHIDSAKPTCYDSI